jgi:hypothetical protein
MRPLVSMRYVVVVCSDVLPLPDDHADNDALLFIPSPPFPSLSSTD